MLQNLKKYLETTKGDHTLLSVVYMLKEILYLLNIITQVYVLNVLFDGHFLFYKMQDWERVFPKITFCTYKRYSARREEVEVFASCLLPINSYLDKIFAVLWYIYVVLALLHILMIIYRVMYVAFTPLRLYTLRRKAGKAETKVQILLSDLTYMQSVCESIYLSLVLQNLSNSTVLELLELF